MNVSVAKCEKIARQKEEEAKAAAKKAMFAPGILPGSWEAVVEQTSAKDIKGSSDVEEAAMTTDDKELHSSMDDDDDHRSPEGSKERKRHNDDDYLPTLSQDAVLNEDHTTRASKRKHHEQENQEQSMEEATISGPVQGICGVQNELTREDVRYQQSLSQS